jgi:hypothetical protein
MNLIKNIVGKDISSIVYKYLIVNIEDIKFYKEDICDKIKTFDWYCKNYVGFKFKPHDFKYHYNIDYIHKYYQFEAIDMTNKNDLLINKLVNNYYK